MTPLNIFKKQKVAQIPNAKNERPRTKRASGIAPKVLKGPHVTEKATFLGEKNQYVFLVWPDSNKTETKKAIEEIYGVDVLAVRIINIPKKKMRLGRIEGWKKGYKKAIVRIKEGQKIEIMPK
ncbi:MAG: 50S ribosomal protein L23 [Candidatus Nealsonbacteria bacterium]|nr:50S ribosomal protein L23 [Candidatus Nealsonbacteria bacterium]